MTLNSTSRPTDYEPRYLNSYALLKYPVVYAGNKCLRSASLIRILRTKRIQILIDITWRKIGRWFQEFNSIISLTRIIKWSIIDLIKNIVPIPSIHVPHFSLRTSGRPSQLYNLFSGQLLYFQKVRPQGHYWRADIRLKVLMWQSTLRLQESSRTQPLYTFPSKWHQL